MSIDPLAFLSDRFRSYYRSAELFPPDRFSRREYGFIFHGKPGMWRHIAFRSVGEYRDFLAAKAPAHAYYSTAYYRNPSAPTMAEKEWMGAELIFDLDADHLENAGQYTYEEQLRLVKEEFSKLVHDFILPDFGFDPRHVQLTFSGGRGYHCHVTDPRVLSLGSPERREIVDYITGNGLEDERIFREKSESSRVGGKVYVKRFLHSMPLPTEPGWHGRAARGVINFSETVFSMQDNEAVGYLETFKGIGAKKAAEFKKWLTSERLEQIRQGNLDQHSGITAVLKAVINHNAVHLEEKGETDEPVTADIKRLIRLPGSIHGKTGLKVVEVGIDELDSFDPLREAVAFGDSPVNVEVTKPMRVTIGGEEFNLKEGETEVPEFMAVFLVGRRAATPL
ncbi:MAG: DNA primase catalytic subunit PriS [Thermoplasmata archaeon HGW-Thermoplasmata-1]|nr:MAG: DNA primase catalytic subunit PriS [Thermoplasmata archaeon HGW-Thermoplasmata-1]